MIKKSKITAEQIEASLDEFCQQMSRNLAAIDEVPRGWFTVSQLGKKLDRSTCIISERLRKMISLGQAERQDFKIKLIHQTRPVPHYRLLKK